MTNQTSNENQSNQNGNRCQRAEQERNDNVIRALMLDDDFNYDSLSNGLKKKYLNYINRQEEKEEYEPIQKTMIIDLDDDDTGGIVIDANGFQDFKDKLKKLIDIKEQAEQTERDYERLIRMKPPSIKDIYNITKAETRAITNYGHKIRRQHGEDKAEQMKDNFINVLKLGKDKEFKFYFDYNYLSIEDRKDYNRLNNLKKYHMINKKLSKLDKKFIDNIYSYGCGICGDDEAPHTINTIKYNSFDMCNECYYNNILKCDNCGLCILEHQQQTDRNNNNYGLLVDDFFNVICDNHYYYPIKCKCEDVEDIRGRCSIHDNNFNLCPMLYDTLYFHYINDDNRGAEIDPKQFINRIEETLLYNKKITEEQKQKFYKVVRDDEISDALNICMENGLDYNELRQSYIYDKKPFKKNYIKNYVYRGCQCDDDNNYRCMTFKNHNNFIKCPYKFHTIAYDMANQEEYITNNIYDNIINNDIFNYYKYILSYDEFKEYINYDNNNVLGGNLTIKELLKRYLQHNNIRYTINNMRYLLIELYNVYRDRAEEAYNTDINDILY